MKWQNRASQGIFPEIMANRVQCRIVGYVTCAYSYLGGAVHLGICAVPCCVVGPTANGHKRTKQSLCDTVGVF
jgi:hypothetical protein